MVDEILDQAIELIKKGDKIQARMLLEDFLQDNLENETAWIWLAETYPDVKSQVNTLEDCLWHIPEAINVKKILLSLKEEQSDPSEDELPLIPEEDLEKDLLAKKEWSASIDEKPTLFFNQDELSPIIYSDEEAQDQDRPKKSPVWMERALIIVLVVMILFVGSLLVVNFFNSQKPGINLIPTNTKEYLPETAILQTTPTPVWSELTSNETVLNRSEITGVGGNPVNLTWVVDHNGEIVVKNRPNNNLTVDLLDLLGDDKPDEGEYLVWLEVYDGVTNQYHKVSNVVTVTVEPEPTFVLNSSASCWSGPGSAYGPALKFPMAGDILPVAGRLEDNSYYQVTVDTSNCWVNTVTGQLVGDLEKIPVMEAPPLLNP